MSIGARSAIPSEIVYSFGGHKVTKPHKCFIFRGLGIELPTTWFVAFTPVS